MKVLRASVHAWVWLGLATAFGCNKEQELVKPPPLEVLVSQPVSEKVADWNTYTGYVEARDSVDIRARVRGEIKNVTFGEGEEVEEGKLLFQIDSEPFKADLRQAKGQLETWEAKLKAAEEKIAIYAPLEKKGTISKEELLQAVAAKGEALGGKETARGKVMEAEINLGYCEIRAPIAGKTGLAMLTKGNIVNSGGTENLLTTVISVDPLYVKFYVAERALLNYQKVIRERYAKDERPEKPKIPVEMALVIDVNFPFKGYVDFIDNKVDKTTGNYLVRARFDNPKGKDGIRPLTAGMFARVRVAIADPYPAILVADRAILSDQSLKYVLVVDKAKNNLVERVDIEPGRLQDDGLRVIDSGLKGGEWIIVEGVNRARPGVTVNAKENPMPRHTKARE